MRITEIFSYLEDLIRTEALKTINSEYYVEPIELHNFITNGLRRTNLGAIPIMMHDLGYDMKIECTFEKIQI